MKIIVIGKQGSGKSDAVNAIKQSIPAFEIVDQWDGISELPDNSLAITNANKIIIESTDE